MSAFVRSVLSLPRLVVMAGAALVACAVVPGPASALGLGTGSSAGTPSVAVSSADKDFASGDRSDRARSERISSPAARAQRVRSRNAHRGLTRDQALAVARRTFPDQMMGRLFDGAQPATGLMLSISVGTERR